MTDPTDHAPRRPDFVVIGAMKAGTTSLYHYLRDHPQIFMPKVKELDFFVEESMRRRRALVRRTIRSGCQSALCR